MTPLPFSVLDAICQHACQQYPYEACGAWVRDSLDRLWSLPLNNRLPLDQQQTQFEADPLEVLHLLKAEDQGHITLEGWYHSHPNTLPLLSPHDKTSWLFGQVPLFPKAAQLIVGILPGSCPQFAHYIPIPTAPFFRQVATIDHPLSPQSKALLPPLFWGMK